MGWNDAITAEVRRLRTDGFSWTHIAKTIKTNYPNELRDFTESQALRKSRNVARSKEPRTQCKQTINNDGSMESITLIELWDNDNITPEQILSFHHLDPKKWELTNCTNNLWHTQGKDARIQMYQSKVNAKPRKVEICLDDIDAYFKNKVFEKPTIQSVNYDPEGESLEICIPDLHTGLLAWAQETGASYDVKIARAAFLKCIYDIADRCKGKALRRIYFVTLGDILHTDNDNQTTAKGTPQQADGRIARVFNYALDMMITALDILGTIAPVEVIYLSGNHDRLTGYTLIKALEMAYRKDKAYTFDTLSDPQKYRLIGCSLVGWTHGDMSRKNMGSWLTDRARKEYGLSKYAEVHAGHLHSESRTETYRTYQDKTDYDDGGIVVRHLPTISNASAWEHQAGYPSGTKTMMCFVWHEEKGLRETWCSNL